LLPVMVVVPETMVKVAAKRPNWFQSQGRTGEEFAPFGRLGGLLWPEFPR
jgi:hypothetical protein